MRAVLHPEARAELRAAALWYDNQRTGLGSEFLADVGATLKKIGTAPHSFPLWPGLSSKPEPIRRAVLLRFPYVLAFESSSRVRVLAIAHGKRRPLYWLGRASGPI